VNPNFLIRDELFW